MQRTCLLAVLLTAPLVHADPLSQADREALIEKLDSVTDAAEKSAATRMGPALAAFRSAMASDGAALELYLKCVEKVEFEDRNRNPQDFREWKRHADDRLGSEGFARALRHKLRWLVLMIDASGQSSTSTELIPRISDAMDSIFGSVDTYSLYRAGAEDLMRVEAAIHGRDPGPFRDEPVTESAFAKAYNYTNLKTDKMPATPLEIAQVFDKVIFPPLRAKKNYESLREQWAKRIRYEGVVRQYAPRGAKGKEAERKPDFEKFTAETLPDLKWQMEEDLYKSGDQKKAAMNMLQHLEEYISNPKARDWAGRFKALIEVPAEPAPTETAEKAAE